MAEDEAVLGWLKRIGTTQTEFVVTVGFPIEEAERLHAFFGGHVLPGDERWLGITAIDQEKAAEFGLRKKGKKKDPTEEEAQKAIRGCSALCREAPFWRWLTEEKGEDVHDEESALLVVKKLTGVKSRHDYINDVFGREAWFRLSSEYHKWAAQPEDG